MGRNMVLSLSLVCLALAGFGLVSGLTKPTSIKLIDNAYTGVVVAIHRDVPENLQLIDTIKNMFTEASSYLYTASRRRAYFKEVTILIPQTWSSRAEYQQASNQSFDLADVIVAPPNPRWAPDPYTKQYQGCGMKGVHIHFWDEFLLEPDIEVFYGPLGRLFVHEWGHYRWGLFDEYADPVGDPDNYQEFYFSPITRKWEPVRCSYDYNGSPVKFFPNQVPYYRPCTGNATVGYEEGCVFITKEDGSIVTGSIMFGRQYYDKVVDFCDYNQNDRPNLHNPEAPNKHNRLCEGKSAWQVMRSTPDFTSENNPPRDIGGSKLIPDFILVQHSDIRVVLVLDVSGSMNDEEKFPKMISAAANYISSIVIEGSKIGIVKFAKTATILSNLVTVNSDDDRNQLLHDLPKFAEGATCIGCGLQSALLVLGSGGELNTEGGIILLLSDGDENEKPSIDDVKDDIVDAGVIVDTIAFTQDADTGIFDLAILTGGTPYYYSNEPGDNTLYDAFAATMERGEIDDHDRRVQLLGNSWVLKSQEIGRDNLFMDETIGNGTEFSVQWTMSNYNPGVDVWVIKPDGSRLNSTYEGYRYDANFKSITYKITDTAEPGAWSLEIRNPTNSQEEVFYTVTSYATDPDVKPILVTSELSGSITDFENGEPIIAYAEVVQGFSPIIKAEVWAKIDRPGDYAPVNLQLLDNGAGADITKHDGVYSRYFTQFTEQGYYGIKITVVNNGTALVLGDRLPASRAIPNLPIDDGDNPPKIGNDTIRPPWNPPTEPTGTPAPLFTRGISGGSSNVPTVPDGFDPSKDYIAPGQIIDLRVSETSFEEATVTLSWSAPGDDLDNGAALSYDIRIADTIPELQVNFTQAIPVKQENITDGDLNNPQEFGNVETFIIRVPIGEKQTTVSYAFAIQSTDDADLLSDGSNVVLAVLRQYIPPTGPPPSPPDDSLPIGAIIGIVVGVIIFIIIIVVVINCCNSKKKDNKNKSMPL